MNLLKIYIYKTSSGRSPFIAWQKKLDAKIRGIIRTRIDRVRLGNFGDCSTIKGVQGVSELRIDFGPGYRIYFGKKNDKIIILLVGGDKKTQKKDILKAKEYWQECDDNLLNQHMEELNV